MNKIRLEIITPEKIAYTDEVDMVMVPGTDGRLGIKPRHSALFAMLTHGELKIVKGDEELYLSIGGGFVEVFNNKVVVLVTRAVNADELNEQEIRRAKQEAEEALTHTPNEAGQEAARMMLRQTIVDLRLLSRRKKSIH